MSILNQFIIASSSCVYSVPVNLNTDSDLKNADFEYSQENCLYEFGLNSPTTTIPVSFNISTNSTSSQIISSSTNFTVIPSFSGGEILIILIGLVFLALTITSFVIKSIDRIVTKKKYLSYNGGDVEIREDL